ncbi:PfkB family carbohydrate kinase [Microbacterium sp. ARD32]|uniref:1-phosphofructokinase family hexose kinase n=1 Tax=Microbacterium sp. ARD32 TaxID=2962577 RepID=UPI002881578F|nr:PfkB family carbohydrate kinase [Microbacterium sp. ARD32]MDT0157701.1 PfkB family carbohydrate kinase [Microbacterium sp. ARD32]
MIVTVTPNPALDLTWHVAALQVGGTHRADAGQARAGGKGLNVARVAHAQGAAALAVTTSGGATGAEFAAELAAAGVPHTLVPVAAGTRRSIALVDEALGDTTIVNEYGTAPSAHEWTALTDAVTAVLAGERRDVLGADTPDVGPIRGNRPSSGVSAPEVSRGGADADAVGAAPADVLVISGSLPPGTPNELLPSLIRLGRDAGATVIVDTSGPALLVAADAGASVLKPNQQELKDATGLEDPIDGARELLRRGAELVLLSLGAEGMLAVSAGWETHRDAAAQSPALSILHARLDAPLAGNPTGAGDAAVAACAVLMDAGIRDPEQILRRATAWSAAAVLMPLAGEIHPSWPDLEHALTVTSRPVASRPVTSRPVTGQEPADPKESR